jgi:glycosyltransferase involved in cell wall biosynthesis
MQNVTIALATYNEERNLKRCLDSVKDLADEIIIVDGSSLDKTVEIAKEFKAIVKKTTNKPNFHINKQMAIDMATKDWILQMDADEVVSPELKEEIKTILASDELKLNGYWMPRKNMFLGRFLMKGGQYPDYTLRLYKNGKGKLPQKDVHEQAVVDGEVGYLHAALLHYPYRNFKDYLRKWGNYNNLFAEQIKEEQGKRNFFRKFFDFFSYMLIKPIWWFILSFGRHKGFMDLWPGFVFSLFSSLRFPVSYIKYLSL